MKNPDIIVNAIGVAYGALLVLACFTRSRLTEAIRIDALFMKQATDATRPLNLFVGIAVAGYAIYSLLTG